MTAPVTTDDCCSADSDKFLCTRISAAFLLLVSAGAWVCMVNSVVPTLASVLLSRGASFSLPVRVGIAAGGFYGLPVLAVAALLLGIGFGMKNRVVGTGILLGAAVVATLLVETLILWGIHDVLPYLAAR